MADMWGCKECSYAAKNKSGIMSHMQSQHGIDPSTIESKDIPRIRPEPVEPPTKERVSRVRQEEEECVDQAETAKLRGLLRRLIAHHGSLNKSEKQFMISWLEVTRDCVRRLGRKNILQSEYDSLLAVYETELLPEIEGLLGPLDELIKKDETGKDEDLELDISRLKSLATHYLRSIDRQTTKIKNELYMEREDLRNMTRKLSRDTITRKSLENFEDILENEIVPRVDALLEKRGTKYKEDDDDDDDEVLFGKKSFKQELRQLKLEEQKLRLDEMRRRIAPAPQQASGLVQRSVIKTGPDGQAMTNDAGEYIMEVQLVPASEATRDPLTQMLLAKFLNQPQQQGDSSEMVRMREDLVETRRLQRETEERARQEKDKRDQEYRDRMERQMYSLQNRNIFREHAELEKELIEHGFKIDKNKTEEQQSIERMVDVSKDMVAKVDKRGENIETLLTGYGQIQLEHMKFQMQQQRQQSGGQGPGIGPVVKDRTSDEFIRDMQGVLGDIDGKLEELGENE